MEIIGIAIMVFACVMACATLLVLWEVKQWSRRSAQKVHDTQLDNNELAQMLWETPVFQTSLVKSLNLLFEQETNALAAKYADEHRIAEYLNDLLEKGELDITKLSDDVQKRAYAMMVKRAEDDLALRLEALADVGEKITETQRNVNYWLEKGDQFTAKSKVANLIELKRQEKHIRQRCDSAKERLNELITAVRPTEDAKRG